MSVDVNNYRCFKLTEGALKYNFCIKSYQSISVFSINLSFSGKRACKHE